MNDHELDLLLSQQADLPDDGFSLQVMSSLPKRGSEKTRLLILFGFTSLGSLGALLFMGSTSLEFFKSIFDGLATYNPAGLAVALTIVMLYVTLFITANEELA